MIALTALLLPAVPVIAPVQHFELVGVSPAVAERLRPMPDRLAGLARKASSSTGAMFAYLGQAPTDPVVTVVVSDAKTPLQLREAARLARGEANRAGILETLFEGKFNVPGHAGAVTYFGDFLTRQGVKQSWIAEYDGVRITISATLYRAEDRRAVFDAIRTGLLGGAEMTGRASAAELN